MTHKSNRRNRRSSIGLDSDSLHQEIARLSAVEQELARELNSADWSFGFGGGGDDDDSFHAGESTNVFQQSSCSSCGHPNPASNKFCGECGTKIVAVAADQENRNSSTTTKSDQDEEDSDADSDGAFYPDSSEEFTTTETKNQNENGNHRRKGKRGSSGGAGPSLGSFLAVEEEKTAPIQAEKRNSGNTSIFSKLGSKLAATAAKKKKQQVEVERARQLKLLRDKLAALDLPEDFVSCQAETQKSMIEKKQQEITERKKTLEDLVSTKETLNDLMQRKQQKMEGKKRLETILREKHKPKQEIKQKAAFRLSNLFSGASQPTEKRRSSQLSKNI